MAADRDRRVRERAHAIWIETGRPDGLADRHWQQAEHEEHERAALKSPAAAKRKTDAVASAKTASKTASKTSAPPAKSAKPPARAAKRSPTATAT